MPNLSNCNKRPHNIRYTPFLIKISRSAGHEKEQQKPLTDNDQLQTFLYVRAYACVCWAGEWVALSWVAARQKGKQTPLALRGDFKVFAVPLRQEAQPYIYLCITYKYVYTIHINKCICIYTDYVSTYNKSFGLPLLWSKLVEAFVRWLTISGCAKEAKVEAQNHHTHTPTAVEKYNSKTKKMKKQIN